VLGYRRRLAHGVAEGTGAIAIVRSPALSRLDADTTTAVSPLRRSVGRVAVGVWAVALTAFVITQGFPFDRAYQTIWILSGLVAASIGRGWRSVGRIFVDWIPFVLVLYLYDYSRHLAELLDRPVMVTPQIGWDRTLFFGGEPTVWLQQHLYDPKATHSWDSVGALVYCSHFLAAWVIAGVLYWRNRDEWFRWARAVVVLSFSALVTFALLPTAPPWYAAREGYLPHVDRIATRGLDTFGLHIAKQLIDQGASVANDVAAIPSLHTGMAVLISIWFYPRVPARHRFWLRPLLVAYPVAMLAMLVYSGEHYVVDGLIGAAYVVAVLLGLAAWDRRAPRRSLDAEAAALEAETAVIDRDLEAHEHVDAARGDIALVVPPGDSSRGPSLL